MLWTRMIKSLGAFVARIGLMEDRQFENLMGFSSSDAIVYPPSKSWKRIADAS
jgi:hypothetical protein